MHKRWPSWPSFDGGIEMAGVGCSEKCFLLIVLQLVGC
jgi:hypothetical protein